MDYSVKKFNQSSGKNTAICYNKLHMQNMESLQLASLLVLGFMFGVKHALDADHIVAIGVIASQIKNLKTSSLLGIFWGIGHTATLFFISLLVLIFKIKIPILFSLLFEFFVGAMLVILGINILKKIFKEKIHFHAHNHEDKSHIHIHQHKTNASHTHIHKSFFIGLIHGLSGSAALMLLVLATVKSTFEGLMYVAIFGIGSIIGMFLVSTAIGIPFIITKQFTSIEKGIKIIAGSISIVMGGIIMYEIGYKNGLLF